jgi:hypothetical protein
VADSLQTNGTPNTEVDHLFLKPGASRPLAVVACRVQGRGGNLTSLSGISIRMKAWTTTASQTTTGNSATTPAQKNKLAPNCVATAGMATGSAAVSNGSGGPNYVGLASMGASGPGGWVAINPDDVPVLDGGANNSLDLASSCSTGGLNWEGVIDNQEG